MFFPALYLFSSPAGSGCGKASKKHRTKQESIDDFHLTDALK